MFCLCFAPFFSNNLRWLVHAIWKLMICPSCFRPSLSVWRTWPPVHTNIAQGIQNHHRNKLKTYSETKKHLGKKGGKKHWKSLWNQVVVCLSTPKGCCDLSRHRSHCSALRHLLCQLRDGLHLWISKGGRHCNGKGGLQTGGTGCCSWLCMLKEEKGQRPKKCGSILWFNMVRFYVALGKLLGGQRQN